MASNDEILKVLQLLGEAYGKEPTMQQIKIYCGSLANIPAPLIEQAAMRWIAGEGPTRPDGSRSGVFFPRPVELRQIAEQIANIRPGMSFDGWVDPSALQAAEEERQTAEQEIYRPVKNLAARRLELEIQFYRTRELDPVAWQAIADAYRRLGREGAAEYTLEKLGRLQQVLETESQPIPVSDWPAYARGD